MTFLQNEKKVLFVSILGEPNAGKSTLINNIVGQKISIVTHKVQTTREKVKGIINIENTQLIFIDTPGIFSPKKAMEKYIVKNAISSIAQADILLVIMDAARGISENFENALLKNEMLQKKSHKIAVINKIDTVDKEQIYKLTGELANLKFFNEITAISATKGKGIDHLLQLLLQYAKPSPWMYEEDQFTDVTMRQLAEEITREKVFLHLHQELPYSIKVETEQWKEDDNQVVINQAIFVSKESQKSIVLGKGGSKIKTIGTAARLEIADMVGKKVTLHLFVKVREDWMDKEFKIK